MRETICCLLGLAALYILSVLGHAFRCFYGPDWGIAAFSLFFLVIFIFYIVLYIVDARSGASVQTLPVIFICVLGVSICLLSFVRFTIFAVTGGPFD